VILDEKEARRLVLWVFAHWLLGGAAFAAVAALYAPVPDVLAALAGLFLGTAATVYPSGHPDLGRWATLRKRAGLRVPRVGDWGYVQIKFAGWAMTCRPPTRQTQRTSWDVGCGGACQDGSWPDPYLDFGTGPRLGAPVHGGPGARPRPRRFRDYA
jgi:hypothetical protein